MMLLQLLASLLLPAICLVIMANLLLLLADIGAPQHAIVIQTVLVDSLRSGGLQSVLENAEPHQNQLTSCRRWRWGRI